MSVALAIIEPLDGPDHGFGWGSKRAHHLFSAHTPEELAATLIAEWEAESDDRRRFRAVEKLRSAIMADIEDAAREYYSRSASGATFSP